MVLEFLYADVSFIRWLMWAMYVAIIIIIIIMQFRPTGMW